MIEERRIIEIFAEFNSDFNSDLRRSIYAVGLPAVILPSTLNFTVLLHNIDAELDRRLEKYRSEISDGAFQNLRVMLQNKFREQVLASVQELPLQ